MLSNTFSKRGYVKEVLTNAFSKRGYIEEVLVNTFSKGAIFSVSLYKEDRVKITNI